MCIVIVLLHATHPIFCTSALKKIETLPFKTQKAACCACTIQPLWGDTCANVYETKNRPVGGPGKQQHALAHYCHVPMLLIMCNKTGIEPIPRLSAATRGFLCSCVRSTATSHHNRRVLIRFLVLNVRILCSSEQDFPQTFHYHITAFRRGPSTTNHPTAIGPLLLSLFFPLHFQ